MAFFSQCLSVLFSLALSLSCCSHQIHARDIQFFSKTSAATITTPAETGTDQTETTPTATPRTKESPSSSTRATPSLPTEREAAFTIANPTATPPKKTNYVIPKQLHNAAYYYKDSEMAHSTANNNKNNNYGPGEQQGMSDTRFLENGRYYYDVSNENKHDFSENEIESSNNGDNNNYNYNYRYRNKNNHDNGNGYKESYGAGEKLGMSDTRFLDNGRYFYDIGSRSGNYGENRNGFENYSVYTQGNNQGFNNNNWGNYNMQSYGAKEKQGRSDTGFLENGRYGNSEKKKKKKGPYEANVIEEDEEDGHDKTYEYENIDSNNYDRESYGTEGKQGLSDTRYSENGRYFYDINKEKKLGNDAFPGYGHVKNNYGYGKEEVKVNGNGYGGRGEEGYVRFSFRNAENKFPEYEFDTMEEYEKHEGNRASQNGYLP